MIKLTFAFLKIFFRNRRALFFVIILPLVIYFALAFLNLEHVIQFDYPVSYRAFLLPGIIAYSLMQVGIYTAPYTLIDYRNMKILKRLSITPLSARHFLLAHGLARYGLMLVQTAVLLAFGLWFTGMPILNLRFFWLPPLILLGTALFLSIGYIIAALSRSYEEAAPYTTSVGLLLTFLGDVFFPVKNLPNELARTAMFLPLRPLSNLLRYVFFDGGITDPVRDMAILSAWVVALYLISTYIFAKKGYR